MKRYIYALVCPINNKIKYIGQTKRELKKRLASHVDEYRLNLKKRKWNTHKFNWMKQVDSLGKLREIQIQLIEECCFGNVNERECFWIEFYKEFNLVNSSPGGYCHSLETIEKIRESKVGERNPNYGKTISQEHKLKIVEANRKRHEKYGSAKSEETKKKISEAQAVPVTVLDGDLNVVFKFNGTKECADFFDYKKSNIKNAIRFSRPIGRWIKKVYWLVWTHDIDGGIERIKNKPENSYVLREKKFGRQGDK